MEGGITEEETDQKIRSSIIYGAVVAGVATCALTATRDTKEVEIEKYFIRQNKYGE